MCIERRESQYLVPPCDLCDETLRSLRFLLGHYTGIMILISVGNPVWFIRFYNTITLIFIKFDTLY